MWRFGHAKVLESEGEYREQRACQNGGNTGQPPKEIRAPPVVVVIFRSILLAAFLVWAVIYWSASVLD